MDMVIGPVVAFICGFGIAWMVFKIYRAIFRK